MLLQKEVNELDFLLKKNLWPFILFDDSHFPFTDLDYCCDHGSNWTTFSGQAVQCCKFSLTFNQIWFSSYIFYPYCFFVSLSLLNERFCSHLLQVNKAQTAQKGLNPSRTKDAKG